MKKWIFLLLSSQLCALNVVVTGGAGFLGSHLCDKLVHEGHHVTCIDNLYTGSLENIQHLMENPLFHFQLHNVIDPFDIEEPLDEIYNLACPASPIHYQRNPVETLKTSFLGALNVLELAKKHNAKVFQASTSEVYGDPDIHPQHELYWGNVNPIGIRSCYDEGKRSAEALFFSHHSLYGTRIKVGRIFNTYGPRMAKNDGRVVSNFIIQALHNEPISIYGDGSQTRSFCFVSDLIDGIIALMRSPDEVTGPINLGNPSEYTVLELAHEIIRLTNSSSPILFYPLPKDDPRKRKPDITLAKTLLHWEPQQTVNEGLAKTITYFTSRCP